MSSLLKRGTHGLGFSGAIFAALAALMLFCAGQAFATHVGCGDTITQDTKLDSDLVNCPGDGIVVGADNITLNLEAHTIDGDGVGFGDLGLDNTAGHDGVKAENGVIREFDYGIELRDAGENRLRRLTLDSRSDSMLLLGSTRNRIDANRLTQGGIRLFASDDNRVENNGLVGGAGIDLTRSARNRLRGNRINGNIEVEDGSDRNHVERNVVTVMGQNRSGIKVAFVDLNVVRDNVVRNGFYGINVFDFANDNLVQRNLVVDSVTGILVFEDSSRNRVEGNLVRDNQQFGILVSSTDDTEIRKNEVFQNGIDGIHVESDTFRTLVEHNIADRNGDDGLDADSTATTLTRNSASRNGDLGIEAVPGVTDGGGNRARDNGNPEQCTNVSCR